MEPVAGYSTNGISFRFWVSDVSDEMWVDNDESIENHFEVFVTVDEDKTTQSRRIYSDNIGAHVEEVMTLLAQFNVTGEEEECLFIGERKGMTNEQISEYLKQHGWTEDPQLDSSDIM